MRSARPQTRSRIGIVLALCIALLVAPLPSSKGGTRRSGPKTTTVEATGGPLPFTWQWTPPDVTIAKREVVRWNNSTDAVHHVTSWDGPWNTSRHVDSGESTAIKFKRRGVYRYWCDITGHADIVHVGTQSFCVGMCGTITVE